MDQSLLMWLFWTAFTSTTIAAKELMVEVELMEKVMEVVVVKLGVGYDPRSQTALLELRWLEKIVKRCRMALDIPTI
ncbi:hypothetical protein YC2023_019089 [Brassica napus]